MARPVIHKVPAACGDCPKAAEFQEAWEELIERLREAEEDIGRLERIAGEAYDLARRALRNGDGSGNAAGASAD